MSGEYTPSGTSLTFTIPAYADVVDAEVLFKALCDDVAASVQTAIDSANSAVEASTIVATNAQAGSYTLVLSDASKVIEMSGGGTLTVPTNASVAFPVGTQIAIQQTGASQVTVAAADGTVTVNGTPGLKLRAQWSLAVLRKRATNSWVLSGDTSA